ncbi:MAG: tRNA glutamyl-Q(34) synthetase GluQRS [Rhodoferax sp.]
MSAPLRCADATPSGTATGPYVGRFAPSPTGPLHAGSLVAALASWLDARAHGGRWLLRIEDVDTTRCRADWAATIVAQLAALGLHPDAGPLYQSERLAQYQKALERLLARNLAYPCGCSRRDIEAALQAQGVRPTRHGERVYPGTCRSGLNGRPPRAWRLNVEFCIKNWPLAHMQTAQGAIKLDNSGALHWADRRLGAQQQAVAQAVGDFVLKRADGCFAYQLAVVLDDAAQGVTDVVRGADLADNTPRQILLQRALGLPTPRYLHTPLVCAADGSKLSKQTGAAALDVTRPLQTLNAAAAMLGLPAQHGSPEQALAQWTALWAQRWLHAANA